VDESKGITFQLLYGGIDDDFRKIPYFNAVADYIDELWIETQRNGYLQTPHREIPLELDRTTQMHKKYSTIYYKPLRLR
jgi:hypothetical protein